MKRLFYTFALVAALLVSVSAQAETKFGARAGLNLTNMKMTGNIGNNLAKDNRAGFYLGPTVKFTLPIVGLGIDASALYDQRTVKMTSYYPLPVDQSLTLRTFTIPVNVRYSVGLGSSANIFAFAGPQYSFSLSGDKKFVDNVSNWTWRSSTVSINLGIGCTLMQHIEVKANYNIACGRTGEAKLFDGIKHATSKANAWQIGMAYWF